MESSNLTRIVQLSSAIQKNVETIDSWFQANELPSPSFDVDYPENLSEDIQQARDAVLIAADELMDLMLGARQIAEGHPIQASVYLSIQTAR